MLRVEQPSRRTTLRFSRAFGLREALVGPAPRHSNDVRVLSKQLQLGDAAGLNDLSDVEVEASLHGRKRGQLLSQGVPAIRDFGGLLRRPLRDHRDSARSRYNLWPCSAGKDDRYLLDSLPALCDLHSFGRTSAGRRRARWQLLSGALRPHPRGFEIPRCAVYCTSLRVLGDSHRSLEHVHGNRARSFGVCPAFTEKD